MEEMGITIRTNTTIGAVLMIDNLFRDGYKSIFIGTGAEKPRTLGLQGESLGNVLFGLNYLANPQGHKLGDTVAIIGMGNAAMDCARTAVRNGAQFVTCVNRTGEIKASQYEASYAKLEGVEFLMNKCTMEIREDGVILADSGVDEGGRITPVAGSEKLWPCDSVIIAVSQEAESNLVRSTKGIDTESHGLLSVDEDGRTSRPGVFAADDAVNGARTVVEAVANGKRVAEAMHAYMQTLPMPVLTDYPDAPSVNEPEAAAQAEQVLGGVQ